MPKDSSSEAFQHGSHLEEVSGELSLEPFSRRAAVRLLAIGSALSFGLLGAQNAALAQVAPADRAQPRRFRLAPPVGAGAPASAAVNRGFVDGVKEELEAQLAAVSAAAASESFVSTQVDQVKYFVENIRTANYTLQLSDVAKVVAFNSASNLTLTVPSNTSVAFPTGTVINVYRAGTGTVTITGASGVTVRNAGAIATQFSEASLRKRATNEWVLSGDIG